MWKFFLNLAFVNFSICKDSSFYNKNQQHIIHSCDKSLKVCCHWSKNRSDWSFSFRVEKERVLLDFFAHHCKFAMVLIVVAFPSKCSNGIAIRKCFYCKNANIALFLEKWQQSSLSNIISLKILKSFNKSNSLII